MPSFNDFLLQPATRSVLAKMGVTEPTPIQSEAIPALLAGKDVVGQSATGSGKTLAYSIPLVERLSRDKRTTQALVLVPTRELAVQVNTVLSKLATSRHLATALLVGGRPYGNQISALRYGAQIVVGTPGRVKDHLERGTLVLSQLRICVLDEADQMLDIGFAPIIEEILATTPDNRQMALFSATMPEWIAKLQEKFLKDPVKVDITVATGGQSTIEQIAYQVPHEKKMAALCTLLLSTEGESSLIFGKTKFGVEKLGKQLARLGFAVGTLHGDKSQRARDDVLAAFRRGQVHTLLATNVAARGLDIQGIYQVINYELPESSELFTHRIGRTGRMGRQGKAITLLVPSDLPRWRRMARSLGQNVALQRLAIDEEAMMERTAAQAELGAQDFEPFSEQRPGRDRGSRSFAPAQGQDRGSRSFAPVQGQDRNRSERPRQDRYAASSPRRRQRDDAGFEGQERTPEWQPEVLPIVERERPAANNRPRDARRGAGNQASFGRNAGKYQAPEFPTMEAEYEQAPRRKKVPAFAGTESQVPGRSKAPAFTGTESQVPGRSKAPAFTGTESQHGATSRKPRTARRSAPTNRGGSR